MVVKRAFRHTQELDLKKLSHFLMATTSFELTWPGTVDQKNPLQSGSSKMYGNNLVNNLTQFSTKNNKSLYI